MIKPTLAARLSVLMMAVAVAAAGVASAAPVDQVTGAAVAPAAPTPPPAGAHVPTATKVIHPVAFNEETKIRQSLVQVALAREAADLIIRGANVLNVFTLMWMPDTDIVVKGKRIAWVGPTGQGKGRQHRRRQGAIRGPGFRRIAQAHRKLAAIARMGGRARDSDGQHLDQRRLARVLKRERPAQRRVLADSREARQSAENLPGFGLRHTALRLRSRWRQLRLPRGRGEH